MAIGNDRFSWFYDYGWFTGSVLGGTLYYALGSVALRKPSRLVKPIP